ncbi:MAG: Flp pilus assembly protein CpaB [Kiritimatiellae bacterium]|nr:Flp pilus assembly protein CpaB [Kiritimatiellia bacterium]
MNKNIALVIALLLGVAAVALMFGYIRRSIDAKTAGWDMVTVLVAADDLPQGTTLTSQNIARRPYPAKYVSDRAITPDSIESVVGGELTANAEKGKPILWTDLKPAEIASGGLARDVTAGHRAATIPVTQLSSFDSMLRPGMYVDILWTGDAAFFTKPASASPAPDAASASPEELMGRMSALQSAALEGGTRTTVLLLQNVPVLAVGNQRSLDRIRQKGLEPYTTVTLALDEEAARILMHASGAGQFSFLLRATGDASVIPGTTAVGPAEVADFLSRTGKY